MTSLTIMTFNIESFGFFFNSDGTPDGYKTAVVNPDKIEKFQSILKENEVDVLCLQETAIKDPEKMSDDQMKDIYKMIDDPAQIPYGKEEETQILTKASECRSHPFTWPRTTHYYGKHSYIANSIYVKDGIPRDKSYSEPISKNIRLFAPDAVPRCFSSIEIQIDGIPITIATTHLLGGRFDDKLIFTPGINPLELIDEKIHQLSQVISANPDIICGDFNTRLKPDDVLLLDEITNYTKQMTVQSMKRRKRATRKRRFNSWIYMDKYHKLLVDAGYASVYNDEYMSKETSAYGGIVDYIYYKKDKLALIGSPQIIDSALGEKLENRPPGLKYKITEETISDHSPVIARFNVLPERGQLSTSRENLVAGAKNKSTKNKSTKNKRSKSKSNTFKTRSKYI